MSVHGFVVLITKTMVILACSLSVFAQINRPAGQWVGDLFLVNNPMGGGAVYLIDENNIIKKEIPYVMGLTDFPIPRNLRSVQFSSIWHNDGLSSLAYHLQFEKDSEGSLFRQFTFIKWQDDEWHVIGAFKSYNRMVSLLKAIPCSDDRFITISNTIDLAGNTGVNLTPFAKMSLNSEKKEIGLISSIDHGQDELREFIANTPFFSSWEEARKQWQIPGEREKYASASTCFDYAFFSEIITTGDYATLLNYKTGLYWVFSLEKASLIKAGNIFKKVTPKMIAGGGFDPAVLCAHPEKDGTILISALAEESFITEANIDKEMNELSNKHNVGLPNATMTVKTLSEIWDNRQKEQVERNPVIEWYRIYPEENGRVEKIYPPEGAALVRETWENNVWRPMPDGSVSKNGSNNFG